MIKDLSIKVADPGQIITSLSGGNQQKVVVAKGLLTAPKILLLDEPSRGIDVAAKSEIFCHHGIAGDRGLRRAVHLFGIEGSHGDGRPHPGHVQGQRSPANFLREEATEEALVAASAIGHSVNRAAAKVDQSPVRAICQHTSKRRG